MALQALAKYAATAYEPSEEIGLVVKSTGNFQHSFRIQADNRLVSQQKALPYVPGVYMLEASGRGCAYVQVSLEIAMELGIGRAKPRGSFPASRTFSLP